MTPPADTATDWEDQTILGLIGSSAIQPLIDNLTTAAPGPAKQIVTSALKGLQQSSGTGVLFVVALAGRDLVGVRLHQRVHGRLQRDL
jgi:hypothetical protein